MYIYTHCEDGGRVWLPSLVVSASFMMREGVRSSDIMMMNDGFY